MIHILNLIILNSLFDIRYSKYNRLIAGSTPNAIFPLFSLDFELDALKIKPVK